MHIRVAVRSPHIAIRHLCWVGEGRGVACLLLVLLASITACAELDDAGDAPVGAAVAPIVNGVNAENGGP